MLHVVVGVRVATRGHAKSIAQMSCVLHVDGKKPIALVRKWLVEIGVPLVETQRRRAATVRGGAECDGELADVHARIHARHRGRVLLRDAPSPHAERRARPEIGRRPIGVRARLRCEVEGRSILSVQLDLTGDVGGKPEERELVAEAGRQTIRSTSVERRPARHVAVSPLLRRERSRSREVEPFPIAAPLRDHIHDADHRVAAAVHDGAGAEHELDMIDQLERDSRSLLVVGRRAPRFVVDVAIDDEKDVITVVARDHDAASADLDGVQRVLGDETHSEKVDRFVEAADPVALDVFRGEDRRRGGRVLRELRRLGGSTQDVLVEQPRELFFVIGRCGANVRRRGDHERESDDEGAAGSSIGPSHDVRNGPPRQEFRRRAKGKSRRWARVCRGESGR